MPRIWARSFSTEIPFADIIVILSNQFSNSLIKQVKNYNIDTVDPIISPKTP